MNLEPVLRKLKAQGLKLTPQRTEILRVLMGSHRPLSAQEVFHAVRAAHPNVSLDTVYRNLTMLTGAGLANQVNLQNRESSRFEFQGEGAHHHHMVCLGCGRSFCVPACPTPLLDARPAEDPDFRVVGHAFEVYGYCSGCQSQPH